MFIKKVGIIIFFIGVIAMLISSNIMLVTEDYANPRLSFTLIQAIGYMLFGIGLKIFSAK